MAFIPVPNTAEVVIQQSMSGQDIFNVINFTGGAPFNIPDLNILATEVQNAWIEFLAPIFSTGLDLMAIRATALDTASSPGVLHPVSVGTDGNLDVAPTQNNVALVLTMATDLRGRSYRGRLYAAGLPSTLLASSTEVSSAYLSDFIDAFAAFFEDIEDSTGFTHVIVSRYTSGAARVTGVTTEVSSYAANAELDSQRRRLKGRGT